DGDEAADAVDPAADQLARRRSEGPELPHGRLRCRPGAKRAASLPPWSRPGQDRPASTGGPVGASSPPAGPAVTATVSPGPTAAPRVSVVMPRSSVVPARTGVSPRMTHASQVF